MGWYLGTKPLILPSTQNPPEKIDLSLQIQSDSNGDKLYRDDESDHCVSIEFFLPVTIVIIPDVLVINLITKLY